RRLPRVGRGDPHRLRTAVAVRERQRLRIHRADPRRDRAARAAPAVAVPQATQAQLEDELRERGGGVMSESNHDWMYWVIGAVVLVLCIVGVITYSGNKQTAEAQAKA